MIRKLLLKLIKMYAALIFLQPYCCKYLRIEIFGMSHTNLDESIDFPHLELTGKILSKMLAKSTDCPEPEKPSDEENCNLLQIESSGYNPLIPPTPANSNYVTWIMRYTRKNNFHFTYFDKECRAKINFVRSL